MRISDWSSTCALPICARQLSNWGNRRSLKAGAHPCQNATTHREKRLRGAGFAAPPRALHGTEIIGIVQRAKGGGVIPHLWRHAEWPRFAWAASPTAAAVAHPPSQPSRLRTTGTAGHAV